MQNTKNTPQELGRTESAEKTTETKPSTAWINALTAQATAETMDDVYGYALGRARWIEIATRRDDPDLASELVQNALVDTFAGRVTWDPDQFPLNLHLKCVIRGRSAHVMERAGRFRHLAVEDAPEEEVFDSMSAEAARSCALDIEERVGAFVAAIRDAADGDRGVIGLLELYVKGVTERCEIMRITGVSATDYRNARRRLLRLVENLPEDIRNDAIAAMA